jgi:hypothetical protein
MSAAAGAELERLYGTDEPPVAWRTVRAGPLSADLEAGQLRYVRWHGVEVLRAVSFLVRDAHWGTYAAAIDGLEVAEEPEAFTVRYRAHCAPGAGDFSYRATISGEAGGRLRFEVEGAPAAALSTNRTGFVVLHPLAGVVGEPIEVEHTGGAVETVTVRRAISPREPIRDIFALTHRPAAGLSARVEMTGDAYDMEDQRNWTDASLKTYVRPLSKPWPYTIAAGETVRQSVTVTVGGVPAAGAIAATGGEARLAWRPAGGAFPRFGLMVEGGDVGPALAQAAALRELGAGGLILRPGAPADLAGLADLARALGVPATLQVAIPATDPAAELAGWAAAAAAAGLSVAAVLAMPYRLYPLRPAGAAMGEASLADIVAAARAAFPGAAIGGGVLTGFPEFNRNRPPPGVDFVAHGTSAIVHAADDRSVLETLEALPDVFASAHAIAPGTPYRVGPAAIGRAPNPAGPPRWRARREARRTLGRHDPRHGALFGAAWAVGYTAAAAAGGVAELTLGHATGDFGVLGPGGAPRPLCHVLRGLARGAGSPALAAETGTPALAATGFTGPQGEEIWLANLTPAPRRVVLPRPARAAVLEAADFERAAGDPGWLDRPAAAGAELRLGPFAVARLVLD